MFDKTTVNNYGLQDDEVRILLVASRRQNDLIISKLETIMATLDELLADVTEENTKLDSLSTLIDGLRTQLSDALAGTTLPPATQAKVDAIFAQAEANKAKIQTALDANVPK